MCFNFLAAIMQNELCSLSSRSLMARSVSRIRFSHVDLAEFCMLYCSPRSSNFCSSVVNFMSVRLMVHGYVVGRLTSGFFVPVLCLSIGLSSFLFIFSYRVSISLCRQLFTMFRMVSQQLGHRAAQSRCLWYSCSFSFAFLVCINLISWLSQKCVAARTVFWSRQLLPFILMEMYAVVRCFDLWVLLNQMAAVVLCSLRFRFLNSRISFACLALAVSSVCDRASLIR
jgi:hypothetical protein